MLYTIWCKNIRQPVSENISGASSPVFRWGDCTQMWNKDAPADHMTLSWLKQVLDGMEQHRRVHYSFIQTVATIAICVNGQDIIKV